MALKKYKKKGCSKMKMKIILTALLSAAVLGGTGFSYYHASASNVDPHQLPKEKQEILARQAHNKLVAQNDKITKKDSKNGPLVIQHDRAVTTQLLVHIEDPINDLTIKFTNGWVSTVKNNEMKGRTVTVEAGVLRADPAQGVVVVMLDGASRNLQSVKQYKTPAKHGEVKIIGNNGFNLKLQAKDGTKWTFNVPSGKFLHVN
jgi:hypothetical protein